jgi:GxxExxY protein
MNTDRKRTPAPEAELTQKVLAAAFKVLNTLGCGFLERVYEKALLVELTRSGIRTEKQKAFHVLYEGAVVGEYQADLVVDGRVIVECKAVTTLDPIHEAQLLNYLKAAGIRVGLLLNFGRPKLQYRRFVV